MDFWRFIILTYYEQTQCFGIKLMKFSINSVITPKYISKILIIIRILIISPRKNNEYNKSNNV